MNFNAVESAAVVWLESHKDFQLVFADKSESRLQFSCSQSQLCSFFIICPASIDGNWVVGTDIDNVFRHLTDVRSYCQASGGQDIHDILDHVNESLRCGGRDDDDEEMDPDNNDDDDDNEDDTFYYAMSDGDVEEVSARNAAEADDDDDDCGRFAANGNPIATNRLLSDMKMLKRSEGQFGIEGSPRGDNLFVWDVSLSGFSQDSRLASDLEAYAKKYSRKPAIELEMSFPDEYPMKPPFVRVIRPRFKFLTGHITVGGSICMEVLTASGWSPSNDIESILVQIRATIMSDSGAQLDTNPDHAYTEREARDAFQRMVVRHGWNK